jgi:hypothetical protein
MKTVGFTFLYAFSILAFSAIIGAAYACSLTPIQKKTESFNLKIDHQPVNLLLANAYSFKEAGEGDNVVVRGTSWLGFDDFDGIYERFVELRMTPKSKCDVFEPSDYMMMVDPGSGMALGAFYISYEDKRCFSLRFFDPITDPGVSKESKIYKSGRYGFTVKNAFQPKIENGAFVINMATIYEGGGEKITKKLSEYELEGFLGSNLFKEFATNAFFSGKFEMLNSMQNTEILDMRFKETKDKKKQIKVTLETVVPKSSACSIHQSLIDSGKWSAR